MPEDSAAVLQHAAEAFNKGDANAFEKLFGSEMQHDVGGRLKWMHGAFPDVQYKIDHVQADGPHLTFTYTANGTNKGKIGRHNATNKAVQWHGTGVATVSNGKIVSVHVQEDLARLSILLGIALNPTMTGTWSGSAQGTNVTLKLVQNGNTVTGTATVSGLQDTFAVHGTNNYPNVSLGGSVYGLAVSFTGKFTDNNAIPGTLSIQGFSPIQVTLKRQ